MKDRDSTVLLSRLYLSFAAAAWLALVAFPQLNSWADLSVHRHFPPWAPMQVAVLAGGDAMAVGLAYSRVTSPDPTVWFDPTEALLVSVLSDDLAEPDSRDGQLARLRPGAGDWRTGWLASHLGEFSEQGQSRHPVDGTIQSHLGNVADT